MDISLGQLFDIRHLNVCIISLLLKEIERKFYGLFYILEKFVSYTKRVTYDEPDNHALRANEDYNCS
jgi:hypothetical protein